MRRPGAKTPINVDAMTRKIDVDNKFSLRNYYRIADSLLKQANIYRAENNIIDLYIILLRYSSLVSETIPYHRDFQTSHSKDRVFFRKMLLQVMGELEALKPEFKRQIDELSKDDETSQPYAVNGSTSSSSQWPGVNNKTSLSYDKKQLQSNRPVALYSPQQKIDYTRFSSANSVDTQFQKLSIGLPHPKQETLSRHSILGPHGLSGQWMGPTTETKVNYPKNTDNISSGQDGLLVTSNMESVLSLDDGRWSGPLYQNEKNDDFFSSLDIKQPSPPPVLAKVRPISPSRVADPRPGPAKTFEDQMIGSNSFRHLHIPVKMMDDFLRLAQRNTSKNLETCAILAGSLKNRVFHITTLIVPKQESTSDSCQTLNEEELFDIQDKRDLFSLGWIHTHPSQTCFMSSVDLHTHYSYQIMLPEAIAIVMAPTDDSSPHGIFHLSDPGGVSIIRNCEERGFHPHEEPQDGTPIYEHCSHVFMNPNLKFDLVDLR